MLYFYSAVVYTKKGKVRIADVKEIKHKIDSKKSFELEAWSIQKEICSELKRQKGIELEPDDIVFVAFNPI